MHRRAKRVFVLGLDCAAPRFVFHELRGRLPNFDRLMRQGAYAPLRSCDPPITVPAWACMFSGRDPGELGIYGFRNRVDHSYDRLTIADAGAVREPRAWDIASAAGRDVLLLGVPQTYPPPKLKGAVVSCFLAPGKHASFTRPAAVKLEIDRIAGGADGYIIDAEDFRTNDKDGLLARIRSMTQKRFRVARAWVQARQWDLFCMVEMGPDRLHHAFWRYCDPQHRLYVPGNPYEQSIVEYYQLLDDELGALLRVLDDDVSLFVVSDHGARRMEGGICINEWLIERGLLVLRTYPDQITRLEPTDIDWPHTKAWGEGGYYGRVFINVRGREPQGVVPREAYDSFRASLAAELSQIPDAAGNPLGTVVHTPESLYAAVRGVPPDLLVYFGNLAWRSVGTVGHRTIRTFSNDTGPDDANHDPYGIFIARDEQLAGRGELSEASLYHILPTILDRLALEAPAGLKLPPL